MTDLIVMIGIPGSGKSTYCQKLIELNKTRNWSTIYVSRDEIRKTVVEKYEPQINIDNYFNYETETLNTFIQEVQKGIDANVHTVIADATNITERSRYKLLSKLNTKNTKIIFVNINTPLEQALENNQKRTGVAKVPNVAIISMNKSKTDPRNDRWTLEHLALGYKIVYIEKSYN